MNRLAWIRVSRSAPCPVCGRPDWCGTTADGALCHCMRVPSARRSRDGGWLHVLVEMPRERRPDAARAVPVRRDEPDVARFEAWWRERRRLWDWRDCDGLSLALGVSMESLERLGACYDPMHSAWAFPMRDGGGRIVGIRLRTYEGRKFALTGSRQGIFTPDGLAPDRECGVCVLEGPTDAAAALSLGLPAVGRPSCSGGLDELAGLFRRIRCRRFTVVADSDAPKRRPDGSAWYPGREGAEALAEALSRSLGAPCRVVYPPAKDMRAWLGRGCTRAEFDSVARGARWRVPA